MGLSDIRVSIHTNNILKSYLQNGIIPDEFVVQQQLQQDLSSFFNPLTGTFNVDGPLWAPSNIGYRETSDFKKWNNTQLLAAEDMGVLYDDYIEQVQTLTNKLYDYVTSVSRIRTKLHKLNARIQNLLLVASATDGYTFSFFDTFVDTSETSFISPFVTTAVVNPETQSVQISNASTMDVNNQPLASIETLNLLFLQDSDVNFFVLNPLPPGGITNLSTALLTDIFNNQAVAWQKEITITGIGPLVAQLTVRISPLDPVIINKIVLQTKMTDAANQVVIQCQYSADGVSYFDVPSSNNPQAVSGYAEFNFTPVSAAFFRFIVTKNQSDTGTSYNIGFQYINFQKVSYSDGDDFYSIPISFPDNRPINKLALDTCSVIPAGTDIKYSIVRQQGSSFVEIPISSIEDTSPAFAQVLDISSYSLVEEPVFTTASGLLWTPDVSGRLHMSVSLLASGVSIADQTIPSTMEIFRNLGGAITQGPLDSIGFQVNPSGLPGYFQSTVEINNVNGTTIIVGNSEVILDNQFATGVMSLTQGTHKIATKAFDDLQSVIASNTDDYFAWNMRFASLFDFYNNVPSNDQSFFTYDPTVGDVIINSIASGFQSIQVDYDASFQASPNNDGSFTSSSSVLNPAPIITGPSLLNAGEAIILTMSGPAKWVNEIDMVNVMSSIPSTVSVESSMDLITWNVILTGSGSIPGIVSTGAFKFPKPVYAKYFRVVWISGSQIDTSTISVLAYPPVFLTSGVIQSIVTYQPTGTVWDRAYDTQEFATNQTLTIVNDFDDSTIGTFVETGSWVTDLSSIRIPKIIIIANSNSVTIDPFLEQLQLISNPIFNEKSIITFSFLNPNASLSVTQVRLHALLTSDFEGVTPELKNYRVKLL